MRTLGKWEWEACGWSGEAYILCVMKAARLHVLAVFGLPALVRTGQVVLAQGEEEQQKNKNKKESAQQAPSCFLL